MYPLASFPGPAQLSVACSIAGWGLGTRLCIHLSTYNMYLSIYRLIYQLIHISTYLSTYVLYCQVLSLCYNNTWYLTWIHGDEDTTGFVEAYLSSLKDEALSLVAKRL